MLRNPRHEKFAQLRADGMSIRKAYIEAGYRHNAGNGVKLSHVHTVSERIDELRRGVIAKQEISRDWVVAKLKAIVDANITDVASWGDAVPTLVPGPPVEDGEEPSEPEFRLIQKVEVLASDKIPEHLKGAIAEVSHTQRGIRIKMHSKLQATDQLNRMLGFYEDKVKVDFGLEAIIRQAETLEAKQVGGPGQPWDTAPEEPKEG
jgi:phage terminase small subunit